MPLPDILAKPIFHLIYFINRRMEGAKVAPICRKVMPVDKVRKQTFDQLLEKALAGDPRIPITEGMIYIARAEDFPDKRPFPLDWFDAEIEEWGSKQPVYPLARIRVSPQDFPYLDKVQFSL